MKAWRVNEKGEFFCDIVFAETAGKAKVAAQSTPSCENAGFCDIEVLRMPNADKYYTEGKTCLDWEKPEDRLILVRECGFTCDYDDFSPEECEYCSAKQCCGQYNDYLDEIKEENHV